jgi:hypothetical protein
MSLGRPRTGYALSVRVAHVTGLAALTVMVGISTISTAHAQFPPPARPPKATQAPEKLASPASLPSARSILDRHVVAMGGREAILSHKSMLLKGSLSMPSAGMTGALEVYGALPNKSLLKISIGGVGDVVEGFDGTYAWSLSPMTGPMLLEGKQLDERRFDSDFHSEIRADVRYSSMTTLEQTDFDGKQCYKVRLVRKAGGEDTEFYDAQTGLKAGAITTRETPMGTVTSTVVIMEYRKFGNLLQASTVRQTVGPMEQLIKVDSIEYDTVPAVIFEPPAGIKALIK